MVERIGIYYDNAYSVFPSRIQNLILFKRGIADIPKPILSISLSSLLRGSFIFIFFNHSSKHFSNHIIKNTTVFEVS